jgi:hypothetical protein
MRLHGDTIIYSATFDPDGRPHRSQHALLRSGTACSTLTPLSIWTGRHRDLSSHYTTQHSQRAWRDGYVRINGVPQTRMAVLSAAAVA